MFTMRNRRRTADGRRSTRDRHIAAICREIADELRKMAELCEGDEGELAGRLARTASTFATPGRFDRAWIGELALTLDAVDQWADTADERI